MPSSKSLRRVQLPGRRWSLCVYPGEEATFDLVTDGLYRLGLPELYFSRDDVTMTKLDTTLRMTEALVLELSLYKTVHAGLKVPLTLPSGDVIVVLDDDIPEPMRCFGAKILAVVC